MQCILVGYGSAARGIHRPLLQAAGIMPVAIITNHDERRLQAATDFPQARILPSLEAALELFDAQTAPLVVVVSANRVHAEHARQALLADRDVVVDKPFTLNFEQAQDLARLAKVQRRGIHVFHNRRWDADFLSLRALLNQGRLGTLSLATLRFDRFAPQPKVRWRETPGEGAGLLYDLGPHLIDQALQLWGQPLALNAHLLQQRANAQVDDAFEITFYYEKACVHLGASCLVPGGGVASGLPRYLVHGDQATWMKTGFDPQEALLKAGQLPGSLADWGQEDEAACGVLIDKDGKRHLTPPGQGQWPVFYQGVKAYIQGSSLPPVSLDSVLEVMKMLDAARAAAETGQKITF